MVTEKIPAVPSTTLPKFPAFPSLYTEKDAQRLTELQSLSKQYQDIYMKNFAPEVWANKPWAERVGNDFLSGAPDILTSRLAPTGILGLTPQEADATIQANEDEIQNLLRIQRVATRLPTIRDYMTLQAIRGVLTGEEAQLYDLIPELNPSYTGINRLELTDVERKWFTDYAVALSDAYKSGDMSAVMGLYDSFNTNPSYDEILAGMQATNPQIDPLYILSTVALSMDSERVKEALRLAYPPQVTDEVGGFTNFLWDSVKTQLATYTDPATGLPYISTGTMEGDSALLTRLGGDPSTASRDVAFTDENGVSYSVVEKEDGFYDGTGKVKVANKDAEGNPVTLSEAETWALDNPEEGSERERIVLRFRTLEDAFGIDLGSVTDSDIWGEYKRRKFETQDADVEEAGVHDFIINIIGKDAKPSDTWGGKSLTVETAKAPEMFFKAMNTYEYAVAWYEANVPENMRDTITLELLRRYSDKLGIEEHTMTEDEGNVPSSVPWGIRHVAQWFSSFGQGITAATANILSSVGGWVESWNIAGHQMGDTPITDWLQNTGTSMVNKIPESYWMWEQSYADEGFQASQLLDPRYMGSKMGQLAPPALAFLTLGKFGMPIAGGFGAAGASALRLTGFARTAVSGILKYGSAAVTMRVYESGLEAGGTYNQLIAMGKTEQEAAKGATDVFVNNLKYLTPSDMLELFVGMTPFKPFSATRAISRGLLRTAQVGGKMVIVGLKEGGEEYFQQAWQRMAMGDSEVWNWDGEMQQCFAAGAMGGIVMGAGVDIIANTVKNTKKSIPPELQQQFEITEKEKGLDAALEELNGSPAGLESIQRATMAAYEAWMNGIIKTPSRQVYVQQIDYIDHTVTGLQQAITKEEQLIANIKKRATADGVLPEEQKQLLKEAENHSARLATLREQWVQMNQEKDAITKDHVTISKGEQLQLKWDTEMPLTQRLQLIREAGFVTAKEIRKFIDKKTNTLKTWEQLTPSQQETLHKASQTFVGKEVSITNIQEQWDTVPESLMYWKESLCDKAGIARTAAHKPWSELTDTQREKLLATFPSEGAAPTTGSVVGRPPMFDIKKDDTDTSIVSEDEDARMGAMWNNATETERIKMTEYLGFANRIEVDVTTLQWKDLSAHTKNGILFRQRSADVLASNQRNAVVKDPVVSEEHLVKSSKPNTLSHIQTLKDWIKTNTKLTEAKRKAYLEQLDSINRGLSRSPSYKKEFKPIVSKLLAKAPYVGLTTVYEGQKVTVIEVSGTGAVKFQYEDGTTSQRWVTMEMASNVNLLEMTEHLSKAALDLIEKDAQARLEKLTKDVGYTPAPPIAQESNPRDLLQPKREAQAAPEEASGEVVLPVTSRKISLTDWTTIEQKLDEGKVPVEQKNAIHNMLNTMASNLQDVGIRFNRKELSERKGTGFYQYAERMIQIFQKTFKTGKLDRTVIHESWHALSDFLPKHVRDEVVEAWTNSCNAFVEQHPWFADLMTTIAKDGHVKSELFPAEFKALMEKYPDQADDIQSHFKYNKKEEYFYLQPDKTYYLFDPDEWLAERCTQRFLEVNNLLVSKGVTNVVTHIKTFLKTIVEQIEAIKAGTLTVDKELANLFAKDLEGRIVAKFAAEIFQQRQVEGGIGGRSLINDKNASKQAKKLPNMLPEKERAKDYAKGKTKAGMTSEVRELLGAVEGNNLSIAFVGFTNTGDVTLFLDNMPSQVTLAGHWNLLSQAQRLHELKKMNIKFKEGEEMTMEELSKVPLQILENTSEMKKIYNQLQNHKFIPWVSDEFLKSKFSDSSRFNLNIQPAVDVASVIDGGMFGGKYRMDVFQVSEQGGIAKMNYEAMWARKIVDIARKYPLLSRPNRYINPKARYAYDTKLAKILEKISVWEDTLLTAEQLIAQKPEIAALVKKFSREEQLNMVNYCKGVRISFEELLNMMNMVRVRMGRPEIKYRENYVPSIRRTTMLQRTFGFGGARMEQKVIDDWYKPSGTLNPRAMERNVQLKDYEKVMDIERLLMDYVSVAAKEIFYSPMAASAKAHAAVLEEMGVTNAAKWTENWANRNMLGIPDALTRWRMETSHPAAWNLATLIRSRLNVALFGLNPMWNLFVQTSSLALSNLHTGSYYTFLGVTSYLFDKKTRAWVKKYCPSVIYKSQATGSLMTQELQTSMMSADLVHSTPLQVADKWSQIFTTFMETTLTGMCCAASLKKGRAMGITDKAKLIAYASDGGAKTQSMYDMMHRPQILTPTVTFAVPFQIFSFEALTRVREMGNIHIPKYIPLIGGKLTGVGQAGAYETVAANSPEGKGILAMRMVRFAEFAVAIIIANMFGEYFNKRKPWATSSFIPFYNMVMWGFGDAQDRGQYDPVFTRWYNEAHDAVATYLTTGEMDDFIQWAVKWHTTGGFQIAKSYRGILAVIEGEYEVSEEKIDSEGNITEGVNFDVESADLLNAIVYGVWGTEQGQEYVDNIINGLPTETRTLVRRLTESEAQLGTSVNGKWYTLGDYRTEAMNTFKDNNIPAWMVSSDAAIYSPLTQFAATCDDIWEEYKGIVDPELRLAYRIANPYIDATLAFWEVNQKVRTQEALNELGALWQLYGVNNNMHMTVHGLPEYPDWFKLLPE